MFGGGSRVAESTQARIDETVRTLVMGVFDRATAILEQNRSVLEHCAKELLKKETLDEQAILELTRDLARPPLG
jgi:cell division protease FtsH